MLEERDSSGIHIGDVARKANVGVQTIYYHFGSRNQLVAEAQASIYFRLIHPLHEYLLLAEVAVVTKDELAFWSAVRDNLMLVWSYGQGSDRWMIPKLLIDIWADPNTQKDFSDILNIQFSRWIDVLESSKSLGWIDEGINTDALVTSCWAGSIGQSIFSKTSNIDYSPQNICDFYVNVARLKR
jgi:AcrR family transcriptional regulator